MEFFRFPHTPHLVWLAEGSPRDDKVFTPDEVNAMLHDEVVVEEKLDGANLGFSLASDGTVRAQNRGQYVAAPFAGQFLRLPAWLALHSETLRSALTPNIILFGEWCAARHSLDYKKLPDWFLLFDVYDRSAKRFWSTSRRNRLALSGGMAIVPELARGKTTVTSLKNLVASVPSRYRQGPLEGVVIRRESAEWCETRAKLVRSDFIQSTEDHWRRRTIEWNRVDVSSGAHG